MSANVDKCPLVVGRLAAPEIYVILAETFERISSRVEVGASSFQKVQVLHKEIIKL